jgi:hypothetical protein
VDLGRERAIQMAADLLRIALVPGGQHVVEGGRKLVHGDLQRVRIDRLSVGK